MVKHKFTYSDLMGELSNQSTADGSPTLYSNLFKESFHSKSGAIAEARIKFLAPADVNHLNTKDKINVLDVCVGMGYNSACLLESISNTSLTLHWWGLELDPRPLKIALQSLDFTKNWSREILNNLESLVEFSEWNQKRSKGIMLWGDARNTIKQLPTNLKLDLILLDAFSPSNCPSLWSKEFLFDLSSRLSPGGKLITYCTAAAIRNTLRDLGLEVLSLKPSQEDKKHWSIGTVAIFRQGDIEVKTKNQSWVPLSPREEEHLLTKASIPYRDPTGESTSKEILIRRKIEQSKSNLECSSSWQKRWEKEQLIKSD